jgi:hypothetical protein
MEAKENMTRSFLLSLHITTTDFQDWILHSFEFQFQSNVEYVSSSHHLVAICSSRFCLFASTRKCDLSINNPHYEHRDFHFHIQTYYNPDYYLHSQSIICHLSVHNRPYELQNFQQWYSDYHCDLQ